MEFAVSACGGNGGKLKILESVLILFLFFSGKGGGTRFSIRWILHVGLLHGSGTRVNWSTLQTRIPGTTVRVIFYPRFSPSFFFNYFFTGIPAKEAFSHCMICIHVMHPLAFHH